MENLLIPPPPWTGRVDGTSSHHLRWHQSVTPLRDDSEPGACVFVGFACDEGVERNKGRRGAARGPDALRGALSSMALAEPLRAYDAGTVAVTDNRLEAGQMALGGVVAAALDAGQFPVVLGGDCSIQLGATLALRRIGRYGLAAIDGSADFRHLGNSDRIGAAGGEELAISTGRGQADLADLEGLGPYLRDEDVRLFGMRDDDEDRAEMAALKISNATVGEIREWGPDVLARAAAQSLETPALDGFWVHLDADVLDPSVMPAVDSPDDGGLFPDELAALLGPLVGSPRCVGLNVTIYDPDLDPDGTAGTLLTDLVVGAFAAA